MATPRISVVIPTRNRAEYLVQALHSVFAQTYTDYEIVVMDDGSTDDTAQRIAAWVAQDRIRYFARQPQGVSAARNAGVAEAHGEYIAFLDSDDLFEPTKLEKQIALFDANPTLGFVHCWFSKFQADGTELGVRDTSFFQGAVYPQALTHWSALMAMPCMLVRREVFVEVGGFDESMRWAEDMDLWRRIMRRYEIDLVPESLVRVRVHTESTSFDKTHATEGFVHYLRKAQDEDPGLPVAFWQAAWARLYTNLAQNLLGEGGAQQMQLARQHVAKALYYAPLNVRAWLAWLLSFLPRRVRHWLVQALRQRRHPLGRSGSL